MSELPPGWRWSTVGEVGRVDLGRPRHPDWHTGPEMRPYLRVANVFEDRIDNTDVKQMDFSGIFERYKLHPGDVLLNEGQSPELLGRPAIYRGHPENVAFTNTLLRFRAGPEVLPEWALIGFRRHMHFGRFARESRITTNIAHLSATRLLKVEFPVPPLNDQQRIVEILGDLFSRLEAAELGLNRVSRRADALRSSIALSELTAVGGTETSLRDIVTSIRNGIFVSRPKSHPLGTPILRIGAVRPMSLDLSDLRYSERAADDLAANDALLFCGDLLFTRYNGNPRYVGACAVVPDNAGDLTFPDKLIRARVQLHVADPQYVALACSFGDGRRQIQERVRTTAGQAGISGKDLGQVRLRLPALADQRRAVDRLLAHFQGIDDLIGPDRVITLRAKSLRRALLDAAFWGRLPRRTSELDLAEELAGV